MAHFGSIIAMMTQYPESVITCEFRMPLGLLWLDRPSKLNAFGSQFFEQLPYKVAELEMHEEVRVIVVSSSSQNFSSGLDLHFASTLLTEIDNSPEPLDRIRQLQESFNSLGRCKKPVIAAISGVCIGAGLDLAACADIRLCSSDAIFALRETRLSMVADLGSLQRLPSVISKGHLAEIAMSGLDFSAQKAMEIGLVNEIFASKDELISGALSLAQKIAANSPSAVQAVKLALNSVNTEDLDAGLRLVADLNLRQIRSGEVGDKLRSLINDKNV